MIIKSKPCPICGSIKKFKVNDIDYINWKKHGELIQRTFPYLEPEDRERLITGYCPECWDKLFKEEE